MQIAMSIPGNDAQGNVACCCSLHANNQLVICRLLQAREAEQQLVSGMLEQAEPALANLAERSLLHDDLAADPDMQILPDVDISQVSRDSYILGILRGSGLEWRFRTNLFLVVESAAVILFGMLSLGLGLQQAQKWCSSSAQVSNGYCNQQV